MAQWTNSVFVSLYYLDSFLFFEREVKLLVPLKEWTSVASLSQSIQYLLQYGLCIWTWKYFTSEVFGESPSAMKSMEYPASSVISAVPLGGMSFLSKVPKKHILFVAGSQSSGSSTHSLVDPQPSLEIFTCLNQTRKYLVNTVVVLTTTQVFFFLNWFCYNNEKTFAITICIQSWMSDSNIFVV